MLIARILIALAALAFIIETAEIVVTVFLPVCRSSWRRQTRILAILR